MTKEEAINVLNDYDINFERNTAEEVAEAHEMAIEALKTQPCEDWNAVLDELNRIGRNAFKDDTDYDNLFDFISNLPNVKPQPNEDCISRKEVLDSLHKRFADGFDSDKWWNSTVVLYAINETPSVTPQSKEEPQQKTGRWIEHKHGEIEHIECSECGVWFLKANLIRKSYCPNCGSCNGDMIKNIMRDIANNNGGAK